MNEKSEDAKQEAKAESKQVFLLEDDLTVLEKELGDKYYQLGKYIYELSERRMDEIDRLVNRLVETKVKLSQLKRQCICAYCLGSNPKENKYCGICGKELEQEDLS